MKIIHTLNIDNYFPELTELTLPKIKEYCVKVGAELNIITERKYPDYPVTYEKLQIFEFGKDARWNALFDLDLLISKDAPDIFSGDPSRVYFQQSFPANSFFNIDKYFMRDGRNIGIAAYILVSSNLTHDLWEPLNIDYNISKNFVRRQHIIDEYCLSRNLAKYGFKYSGIGNFEHFNHIGLTTDAMDNKNKVLEIAKNWYKK